MHVRCSIRPSTIWLSFRLQSVVCESVCSRRCRFASYTSIHLPTITYASTSNYATDDRRLTDRKVVSDTSNYGAPTTDRRVVSDTLNYSAPTTGCWQPTPISTLYTRIYTFTHAPTVSQSVGRSVGPLARTVVIHEALCLSCVMCQCIVVSGHRRHRTTDRPTDRWTDGSTVEAAVESLSWEDGDVVVVGSSRLAQPRRLFLGSTASKMLRVLPVPMVVVPATEFLPETGSSDSTEAS